MSDSEPIFIGVDVYMTSETEDGLYEADITCADCAEPIGMWVLDGIVETFIPYWMCDEDNNDNVCEDCFAER